MARVTYLHIIVAKVQLFEIGKRPNASAQFPRQAIRSECQLGNVLSVVVTSDSVPRTIAGILIKPL